MTEANDFKVGDRVTWYFCAPGGYGFTSACDAVVVKIGRRRVQVRVEDHHACKSRVAKHGADIAWVTPEKLRPRP